MMIVFYPLNTISIILVTSSGKDSSLSAPLQPAMFCDELFTYTPAMMDAFLVQKAAIL